MNVDFCCVLLLQQITHVTKMLFPQTSLKFFIRTSKLCIFSQLFSHPRFYSVTRLDKLIRINKASYISNNMYNYRSMFIRWEGTCTSAGEMEQQMTYCKSEMDKNEMIYDIPVIIDMLTNNRNDTDKLSPHILQSQTSHNDDFLESSHHNQTQQLLEAYLKTEVSVKNLEELLSKIRVTLPSYEDPRKPTVPKFSMGTPDPSVPMSDVDCPGCGSLLHCQDYNLPGYIPSKKYISLDRDQLLDTLCFKCFLMKYYNYCLNIKVSIKEYPNILSKIRTTRSLVIVVVDMSDMNNSILKTFLPVIGKRRPIFVIGNKIDIIPMDSRKYLNRLKNSLLNACIEAGWNLHNNIKHVALVSAKTGYGIEDLVSKLLTNWNRFGDIYLVGCTNVGKSSIFNILLQSDFCKSHVRDLFECATVSVWPGTTMNLLKFPILHVTPERMYKRKHRLQEDREQFQLWEEKRRQKLHKYGLSKNAILAGFVGQTKFADIEETVEGHLDVSYSVDSGNSVIEKATVKTKVLKRKELSKMTQNLANSHWLYDTPGIENPEQIINLLEPNELQNLFPKEMLRPRTVKLKSTQVMYITGLGCIEYVKGDMHILLTVISNLENPIHVLEANQSQSFFKENIGTDVFKVPLGSKDRLDKLPPLVSREFNLIGTGFQYIIGDIVLSSIGWVGVSAKSGDEIVIRAFTPGGHGCHYRDALLPEIIKLKKKIIKKSPFYVMKKPLSLVKLKSN